MSATMKSVDYEKQMDLVTDHIYANLDGKLDLDEIAAVANVSKFHWHRIYKAMRGETVGQTVKRMRLHRAAFNLVQTDMPIDEVAEASGYRNLQSFTRAFSGTYGLPPAQFRKKGDHVKFERSSSGSDGIERPVEIREREEVEVIGFEHVGPYMDIGNAYGKLHGWLGLNDYFDRTREMIALYYDDPNSVPSDELHSPASISMDPMPEAEPPMVKTKVAGGRYAVLTHKGPYAAMPLAYDWFLSDWLESSGEQVRDEPMFELYLNTPGDTAQQDLLTDIHMPLV